MATMAIILRMVFMAQVLMSAPHPIVQKWVIERSSNLSIHGRSNVSSFRCDVIEYLQPDTIRFCREDLTQQEFALRGGIAIDINRFDCHQRMMTADLRKMLKAGQGSLLKIDLLSLGCNSQGAAGPAIKGKVAIELAGVTRQMEVSYSLQVDNNGYLHLLGERQVSFADFGLVPPRKAGGLIRVQPAIQVRFELILRAVPA